MEAGAVCLDLTRTLRRAGSGPPTGIDRVERAWADRVALDGGFGLVRTKLGFLLLDAQGVRIAASWEGPRDALLSRLRQCAVARRPPVSFGFRRCVPAGTVYLNAGHSALDRRTLRLARRSFRSTGVILHDVIPLDRPDLARPGMADSARRRIEAVRRFADVIVAPLRSTAADIARHLPDRKVDAVPFGVPPQEPGSAGLPPELAGPVPWVCVIGTIEPRKGHAFLLDLWDLLAAGRAHAALPRLVVIGRRGWAPASLFDRLDARPPGVIEYNALDDRQRTAVLAGARALLFPSLAEGFGFPPLEAAALGVPVIATPLPQTRELLGDWPVYVASDDLYGWRDAVVGVTAEGVQMLPRRDRPALPGWNRHFEDVIALLREARG